MMQLSTNHQLSSALLHMAISPVGWEIKNTFVSDLFFFFVYSSFHTNDVFILEGFQSNQITMALPLIRHNRTLAGGERRRKSLENTFCNSVKKVDYTESLRSVST